MLAPYDAGWYYKCVTDVLFCRYGVSIIFNTTVVLLLLIFFLGLPSNNALLYLI